MTLSEAVRAGLEQRPRRAFGVDEARCAAALASTLGLWYEFPGRDGRGRWWALRRDGGKAVSGATPDELRSRVMADFAANPVRPR